MKKARLILFLSVVLAFSAILNGQVSRQSGVVKGIVIDLSGVPIPGIEVTAQSPALMGVMRAVTDENGAFRLINLPPGNYTITAALDGFKTVKRTDIVVQTGQTFTVNLQTEPSTLKEEITVTGTPPVVDLQSNKMSNVVTGELLRNLPLARNIDGLFNITPGVAANPAAAYSGGIHGGNSGATAYEIDGVNGEDPTTGGRQITPQFDSIEEVELTTGGLPAQVGASGGSFYSVVTKSGGNSFHGQAQAYYTAKSLAQNLFTDEELQSMGRGKPALPIYDLDMSASLGGALIKDKLWFYGSMARQGNEYRAPFQPVTILGTKYDSYNNVTTTYAPFLKLTTQINKNMRFFAMFNGTFTKGVYGATWLTPKDSVFDSNNKVIAATGELNWMLGANTNVTIRGGYNNRDWSLPAKPGVRDNVANIDNYTGYEWGSPVNPANGPFEWYMIRRTVQESARLTHFMDNVLGGNHEIGAGIEYISMLTDTSWARGNPLTIHYYNGDIYYHRGIGDTDPSLGDGLINLSNNGANNGDTHMALGGNRLSGYLQDSFTIKNRLTVNFGVRLDKQWGGFKGGVTTGTDPNGLAYKVGLEMAKTIGFNPYGAGEWGAFKNTLDVTVISPRIGASYDLFGDSKTALKVAWGSYYEAMPTLWYEWAQPSIYADYQYNWFDSNGNGIPDDPGIDSYTPRSGYGQFVQPEESIIRDATAGKGDPYAVRPPHNNEIIVSLSHELAKNLSVKLQYINKIGYNDHADCAYYDRSTQQYWFSLQDAPAGYWVPFTTVVPAVATWPEKEVTVYFRSNNAPGQFWRQISNPYSKRLYNGLELSIDKRYASGWALGGSLSYSQSKSQNPFDPSGFVNAWGFDKNDVPLYISIYGSFKLPYKLIGSFVYRHREGTPLDFGQNFWVNVSDVTIVAPDSWMAANNVNPDSNYVSVMLEPKGTHRGPSFDNIDFRLEKEFKFKFGTISFFADIFNLLGNKYVNVGQNVGGLWRPDGPGVSTGTRTYDYYYKKIQSVSGMRTFRLSARVGF